MRHGKGIVREAVVAPDMIRFAAGQTLLPAEVVRRAVWSEYDATVHSDGVPPLVIRIPLALLAKKRDMLP
jgi:hypothetical protein